MSIELIEQPSPVIDPLDAVEAAAAALDIQIERIDECELHLGAPGAWRDIGLWFTWRPELSTLQMGAPLDIKAPPTRLLETCRLLAMINERLWVGHFDLWSDDHAIIFRNSIVLPETGALDRYQAQCLIRAAGEAVDRFLPALNFLIWGGKSPQEALESSLFETVGNA